MTSLGYRDFFDVNFKFIPAYRERFSLEAAMWCVTNKEFLEEAFRCFLEKYGGSIEEQSAERLSDYLRRLKGQTVEAPPRFQQQRGRLQLSFE